MLFSYFYILFNFLHFCSGKFKSAQCRDHSNNPVDWWYMYKLPFNEEYGESSGRNYTYITSAILMGWQMAPKGISQSAMLYNTLAPMFRSDVVNNVAYAIMDDKEASESFPGSAIKGVFLADTEGGFFMGHSVPGFPDVNRGKVQFPKSELANSHIIYCMSLTTATMSAMIDTIRLAMPNIVALYVPDHMLSVVPAFAFDTLIESKYKITTEPLNFETSGHLLRGSLTIRMPGDAQCIYLSYARKNYIYLDVYSPDDIPKKTFCNNNFGIRSIDSISVKTREQGNAFVQYIKPTSDPVRIAVSTAAHWQKKGRASIPYLACVGTLDREDTTGKGGMLFCVNNYHTWYSFDKFKVAEPSC